MGLPTISMLRRRNKVCDVCGPSPSSRNSVRTCACCVQKIISSAAKFGYVEQDSKPTKSKRIANLLKWLEGVSRNVRMEQLEFVGGFAEAFKKQIHTDILVKTGENGSSFPAHRALLATRSDVLKHMLDSEECKVHPNDTITFQELNYEQLEALLHFLYSGELPTEKLEKHISSLLIAADKYGIPYLQKYCEHQMMESFTLSNVLDVLELADTTCSNMTLKEAALNYIAKNMKGVVSTDEFAAFAVKNPQLTVQIARASSSFNHGK